MKLLIRKYRICRALQFEKWLFAQTEKSRIQIEDRLSMIQADGYFGDHKIVDEEIGVWELKWKNGRRVYYAYIPEKKILLLLGGNKNGQGKDIAQAKRILTKTTEIED